MKLTEKNKAYIDSIDYEVLLYHWYTASLSDPWCTGETGEYWAKKLAEARRLFAKARAKRN